MQGVGDRGGSPARPDAGTQVGPPLCLVVLRGRLLSEMRPIQEAPMYIRQRKQVLVLALAVGLRVNLGTWVAIAQSYWFTL